MQFLLDVVVHEPRLFILYFYAVDHGDDLTGLNVVGVIKGTMCRSHCKWCEGLQNRIQSRIGLSFEYPETFLCRYRETKTVLDTILAKKEAT